MNLPRSTIYSLCLNYHLLHGFPSSCFPEFSMYCLSSTPHTSVVYRQAVNCLLTQSIVVRNLQLKHRPTEVKYVPKKLSHPAHVLSMEVVLFVSMGNRSNKACVRVVTYSVGTVQPTVIINNNALSHAIRRTTHIHSQAHSAQYTTHTVHKTCCHSTNST